MFIKYKNTQIHIQTHGNGFPLVLLHGFLLSSSIWKKLIPELSKKNQVIAIDLPGHGKSECVDEVHSMELMAEVVNFILMKLNIKKANFMGHSMGGYIALAFTEKYESKVKTLILLNSTTLPDSPDRKKNRERAIGVIHNNSHLFIKMAISSLFPEKNQKRFTPEIDLLTKEAIHFPIKGIIAAIIGMKNRIDRTSVLKNFKGDKYMICGENDPIVPFTEVKEIAFNSKTTLKNVKSGHMSVNENIDEIIKIMYLVEFL